MATNEFHNANLEFLVNFDQGITKDEIDYVIWWAMFTIKNTSHYNREFGGGFQNIEQGINRELEQLFFASDTVLSIYLINQSRGFDPYIVVGHTDITLDTDNVATVQYRLRQDLSVRDKTTTKITQNANL